MTDEIFHPGRRIREEVIPAGMSVTEAAKLIGVGRPALSNLLNGNASLSADMAARLSKAFKYPQKLLMEMQARYDESRALQTPPQGNIVAYVPPFLSVKANDIEKWADHNITTRSRLSVFLRTLINSTAHGLRAINFPGNDDAELPGWDGLAEASEHSPWVPEGRSGWEFGTNKDPKAKADKDYKKSVKAVPAKDRADITFVFVTPRRWPAKSAWISAMEKKREWKALVAFDAIDLEQWVAQSLPGQAWFANETQMPTDGVRSLDRCWADWANVASPSLDGSLFSAGIEAGKRILASRLAKPADGPTIVAADSTEEALAFVAQALSEQGGVELANYRDKVLVFDKPGTLPRLAEGARPFIPVVHTREVERELAPYAKSLASIVVYPRNAANTEPHITLEPINYETFNKALEAMGKDRDEIRRLMDASGRSLTVLRRQLATVDAIRTPAWASDHTIAAKLVPFLLVGRWHSENETDKLALSLLAGDRPFIELEKECQALTRINDAPLWSIGPFRGVISKVDLLYAIAGVITKDDLVRYYELATLVLGEDDPGLDLEEDKRWAAAIYGKRREFSGPFRQGISETLVLLAVHGNQLFRSRIGLDTEVEAARVVRQLLPSPLETRVLAANDQDLPTYAEAAPKEFLSILEKDLKSSKPAVMGLLTPASSTFGGTSRTGLLWALEGLAWNLETLPRAAFILARLAQVEINDNWVNKPAHSLESIFRSWMPQTSANVEFRIDLMKKLAEKFPAVAWQLCVGEFGQRHKVGDYSHKPRWRSDGFGYGEPYPTWGPVHQFVRAMVEMALNWPNHSATMLGDLLERVQDLTPEHQQRVWELVAAWAMTADDEAKAEMREKVRTATLSRRAMLRGRGKKGIKGVAKAAKVAYKALEPAHLVNKYAWMFKEGWVEESADEIHEDIEKFDYNAREARIASMRTAALIDVREKTGLPGILELAQKGRASWAIGILCATQALSRNDLLDLSKLALKTYFDEVGNADALRTLISAILRVQQNELLDELLDNLGLGLSEQQIVKLLWLAPYGRRTWMRVDALSDAARELYWDQVSPDWLPDSDAENNESVERLLKAGRPRAAFACVRYRPGKMGAEVLYRLLDAMAKVSNDKPGEYVLEHYHIEEAFKHINTSTVLTVEQKAVLEFAYLEILARPWDSRDIYGIPNLERYVEDHPDLFIQAIVWVYKRKGGDDPPEYKVPPENVSALADRGYKLLDAIERIPGHNDLGQLEAPRLAKWIESVRKSCEELGRLEVADTCLGKLLSNASIGDDGVWPCEPVRTVLEEIQSESIMHGAQIGIYNSRGAHWRGNDGSQERAIADKYRKWAEALQSSHPYVSSELLMAIANTYDREAYREDTEAGIRRRLR
ncbi:MAG TPA: HigA family addiction module antitoxin [Rhizomicrobium sp.]|nr:HigA family addiction module antitoxin [Rhizomicrobium sp.]